MKNQKVKGTSGIQKETAEPTIATTHTHAPMLISRKLL